MTTDSRKSPPGQPDGLDIPGFLQRSPSPPAPAQEDSSKPDVTRYTAPPGAVDTYEILRECTDHELAISVRDCHNNARGCASAALHYALDCGDSLLEGKRRKSGRQWSTWVEGECGLNLRTAKLYVQLAQHRAEIEAAIGNTPELSLRGARELISVKRGTKGQQPETGPSRTTAQALKRREAKAAPDIGENSSGEVERLRARVAELENTNRRLELRAIALESEISELMATGARIEPILEMLERRIPDENKAARQCMRALRKALEELPPAIEGECTRVVH